MKTLDFETEAIVGCPLVSPPRPVGLAIKEDGGPGRYVTDYDEMRKEWVTAVSSGEELLFHNASFDLAVGLHHLGGSEPHWSKVHDTQFLLFFDDPYAKSFSLKPSAERVLGWAPEERDVLTEWILANVPKSTRKRAGEHIAKAPVELVAPYAIGDVERTYALFNHLYNDGVRGPYRREQELRPILAAATVHGIRVDRERLERELREVYLPAQQACAQRIFAKLGSEFNLDSSAQLANAIEKVGLWDGHTLTEKGGISTSKPALKKHLRDKELVELLMYHSSLSTCIGTFMLSWLELSAADGRLHGEWHQTRGDKVGARTGRISSERPNLMNVPTEFEQSIPAGLPSLPLMRQFCVPEEGHLWIKRDLNSQEVRMLAHFEEGRLAEWYRTDPLADPHQRVSDIIAESRGVRYSRKQVKIVVFTIIYGGGADVIADRLECTKQDAWELKNAILQALPGVKTLQEDIGLRGRNGLSIVTWGGRKYAREPHPRFDFSYKLLNYLIQGSSADQSKELICRWARNKPKNDVFLAMVHDDFNFSVPEDTVAESMAYLREVLDADLLDVPMRSSGYMGNSWENLDEYDDFV